MDRTHGCDIIVQMNQLEENCKKKGSVAVLSLHSQPLVSFRMKYPPKILKNPEVLMLQYQGTFDQRQDGWHSSEYED